MRWFLSALMFFSGATAAQDLDASKPLAGQEFAQVEALFGKPQLITRDMPAEIWQYSNDVCVVHIFFYREKLGRPFMVDHVEIRMRDGYADRPELCEAALAGQPVDVTLPLADAPEADAVPIVDPAPSGPEPVDSAPAPADMAPLN